MKRELREFLHRHAEPLGFEFTGYDGRGHIRLRHRDNGTRYSLPSTPSDWRATRNAVADLERLAGRKLARPNAGKYHRHRGHVLVMKQSEVEVETCCHVNALVAVSDSLRARFQELVSSASRRHATEAREVLADYDDIRHELAGYHRIIDPII